MGRLLILMGLSMVLVGLYLNDKLFIPEWIGKLPGDIIWHYGKTTVYLPFTTSLILSVALSILFRIFK